MHPGMALARLNAKTVRFDVGTGGHSELDPQDIAAAIAFVQAGIGRKLLLRVWWADGAALTEEDLTADVAEMMVKEWSQREDAVLTAMLRATINRNVSEQERNTRQYSEAHQSRWPRLYETTDPLRLNPPYLHIPQAVIREVASNDLCSICQGRAYVRPSGTIRKCKACEGTGHRRPTDTARALSCGLRSHSNYVRMWRPVYQWVYDRCRAELEAAERAFCQALR